jgi:hypothetical protein
LTEAKQAEMGDALAETRSVLVRELAEAYELQAEVQLSAGGRGEHRWTLGRKHLPIPEELTRTYPIHYDELRLIHRTSRI